MYKTKPQKRTSRNKRRAKMPLPATNQSMTGSAYSCIDAVNTTSVYHAETYKTEKMPPVIARPFKPLARDARTFLKK